MSDANLYAQSPEYAFSRDVVPHIDARLVEFAYPGKGVVGKPPKNVLLKAASCFWQLACGLTDREMQMELAKNLFLREALGGERFTLSERTIWDFRNRIISHGMVDAIFNPVTANYMKKYNADFSTIRFDATRFESNMKNLNRLQLMHAVNRNFLLELKKSGSSLYVELPDGLKTRYGAEEDPDKKSFASNNRKFGGKTTYNREDDLSLLFHKFRDTPGVPGLKSFSDLARVFSEQCAVEGDEKISVWGFEAPKVRLKTGKEIPGSAMQNPSDPDAGFSRHKGQGYSLSLMENVPPPPEDGGIRGISLVGAWKVTGAQVPDKSFIPDVQEAIKKKELKTKVSLADGAYSGQEDFEAFKEMGVKHESPVTVRTPRGGGEGGENAKITLDQFEADGAGEITACPVGREAKTTFEEKGKLVKFRAEFDRSACSECAKRYGCPVKVLTSGAVLDYTSLDYGRAVRLKEQSDPRWQKGYSPRAGAEAMVQKGKNVVCPEGQMKYRTGPKVSGIVAVGVPVMNFMRANHYEERLANHRRKQDNQKNKELGAARHALNRRNGIPETAAGGKNRWNGLAVAGMESKNPLDVLKETAGGARNSLDELKEAGGGAPNPLDGLGAAA
ncbi:MAG: transposase, partial [Deltaproteobacteria bacterium]|nr:transposase [Deltaproteobacteria bacterium]